MSPSAISDLAPLPDARPVVITGGAGFVGTPLIERLRRHRPVVVIDDLSVGRPFPPAGDGVVCYQADIQDQAALRDIWDRHRPQAVVHLAAIHHIPTCDQNPYHATSVNVLGFQSVLDASRAFGCQRVILASSGAVYGWSQGALSESSPLAPCDVYSASKAANEHQLSAWVHAGHGSGVVARMFNVIGPNDPNGHLIPDLLRRLSSATSSPYTLRMGNVTTCRDFVDVQDMADGFAALLGQDWPNQPTLEVYNLCSGQEHPVQDIALLMARQMGLEVEITIDPALCRPVDRPSQLGDPSKIRKSLQWQTRNSLEDSIAAIVQAWQCRALAAS